MKLSENATKKILLIEDEKGLRNVLTKLFEHQEYDIRCKEDAFQAAMSMGGEWVPDLIILDWNLSEQPDGQSGKDVIMHLWEDRSTNIPIIIFSGFLGSGKVCKEILSLQNEYNEDILKCIPKPEFDKLVDAVNVFFES